MVRARVSNLKVRVVRTSVSRGISKVLSRDNKVNPASLVDSRVKVVVVSLVNPVSKARVKVLVKDKVVRAKDKALVAV